jgi:cytochrome c peroxidase
MKTIIPILLLIGLVIISFSPEKGIKDPEALHAAKVEFGRQLFFDKALSHPDGQSCTVCHAPKTSFSDPNHAIVSEGMVDGAFVNRNSQSLAYVGFIPPLKKDDAGEYSGGLFWDGRSNTLEHQLSGPFFNPAEMNNKDTSMLVAELVKAPYYKMYRKIYGKAKNHEVVYRNMAESIALFERSDLFNEFSSKFDLMLKGQVQFTESEKRGLELFQGKANCVACHSMTPEPGTEKILFTAYGYYNIGVPRNEANPFYSTFPEINPKGKEAVDLGLGGVVNDRNQDGKFRVPTLRNVQYTGPYFHNGYFKTLAEVVHFKNTRDVGEYPAPEVSKNIIRQRIGNLMLTEEEEQDLVAFLLTLTDGYEL